LSDRNLWFFYLEALGFDDARTRGLLAAVDRYEKMGDDAFKGYVEAFVRWTPKRQSAIVRFMRIQSVAALEQEIAALQQDRLTAALADWKKLLTAPGRDGLGNFVQVDLGVVRGLAYYTGFVFEAFDRKGDLRALAGGGATTRSSKKLGGPAMPAVGFAVGDVTTGLLLEQRGLMPNFVAGAGRLLRDRRRGGTAGGVRRHPGAARLGISLEYPMKELAFGKQFKAAADSGAKLALIYGGDELAKGVVKLRDLTERTERDVPRARSPQRCAISFRGHENPRRPAFPRLAGHYAVCRLSSGVAAAGLGQRPFVNITLTDDELAIICPAERVPTGVRAERDWRLVKARRPVSLQRRGRARFHRHAAGARRHQPAVDRDLRHGLFPREGRRLRRGGRGVDRRRAHAHRVGERR